MPELKNKCAEGRRYKTLDRHPLVDSYDDAGMDDGTVMVILKKGYAYSDAAARTEDDPDGAIACHGFSTKGMKNALIRLSVVEPCQCGRCVS